jgi:glycosyltransferase involved in cell wall biosynthesis
LHKLTILHITEQLGIGGTEVLLKNTLPELKEFEHVVVYLGGSDELKKDFVQYPVYDLEHRGKRTLIRSILRLKRIIKNHKPDIVHAHLYWSSIIARFAKPANVRLITTVHSVLSKDAFEKNKLSLWMEKMTASKQNDVIAVSKFALQDYISYTGFKGRAHVVYNFIPAQFARHISSKVSVMKQQEPVKCIAVGNLKPVKNYAYILEAFKRLPQSAFTLDIAGEGSMKPVLESMIKDTGIPVRLMGSRSDLDSLLQEYTVFIQASAYEGFGIAMSEAILSGLVPVLSDIPVHREVTDNKAFYFDLDDPQFLANTLLTMKVNADEILLNKCREYVKDITSPAHYFGRLRSIYGLT